MKTEKVSIKLSFSVTPSEQRALQKALESSGMQSQSKFLRKLMRQSLGDYFLDSFSEAAPATNTTLIGETINA